MRYPLELGISKERQPLAQQHTLDDGIPSNVGQQNKNRSYTCSRKFVISLLIHSPVYSARSSPLDALHAEVFLFRIHVLMIQTVGSSTTMHQSLAAQTLSCTPKIECCTPTMCIYNDATLFSLVTLATNQTWKYSVLG
jgi:hypothetical protein